MYLAVLLTLITACAFTTVLAQTKEPQGRWNQLCDDTLVLCRDTYEKGEKNKEAINWFYNCVYRIHCERWSEGFYNRQIMLGNIRAQKEFYDPTQEWWKNEAPKRGLTLAWMPIVMVMYKLINLAGPEKGMCCVVSIVACCIYSFGISHPTAVKSK